MGQEQKELVQLDLVVEELVDLENEEQQMILIQYLH